MVRPVFEKPFTQIWPETPGAPRRLHPTDTLERLQSIAEFGVLDTPPEAAFDSIAELAAGVCATKMAAISLVCDDRQWFKATYGMAVRETPIEQSFCAHAIDGSDIFVIADAAKHGSFRNNELVRGSFGLRFYAGVPLHSHDGVPVGALCVLDTAARPEGLTADQTKVLATLAKQVEAQLELRRLVQVQERKAKRENQLLQQIEHVAIHDELTGVAGRRLVHLQVEQALASCPEEGPFPALLVVDIDSFKAINDGEGHQAGDQVLIEVARRLQGALDVESIVGRTGSDEFTVLIRQCQSTAHAAQAAEAILDAVNLPFHCNGRTINLEVCVGYALASPRDQGFNAIFRKADLALSLARAAGRGAARGFSAALAQVHDHEREMIDRARAALADDKVVPFYQPKVNLETGKLIGFEALLRIQTADGHIELPASVAAAFEDRELAVALTDRMIDRVIADILGTTSRGIDIGHVAINTTSFDYSTRNFAAQLLAKLAANRVPTSMLEVEVTESVVLGRGRDHVRHSLVALADAGMRISLDDFGTGYASLTNVKQLPISALKIDRSFVSGLGNGVDDAIVLALVTLCNRMGLSIVAEGIETERQVSLLQEFGVEHGQGMYFSPAAPGNDLSELTRLSVGGGWAPSKAGDLGAAPIRRTRKTGGTRLPRRDPLSFVR